MHRALKWIEGILLTIAAVLGIWWVTTLIEAHRANSLPIPPPSRVYDGAPPVARRHFFVTASSLGNILFLAAVLMSGIAAVYHTPCGQS